MSANFAKLHLYLWQMKIEGISLKADLRHTKTEALCLKTRILIPVKEF